MRLNVLFKACVTLILYSTAWAGILREQFRFRRNAAITDPNNIRVTVGTTQTHPNPEPIIMIVNKEDREDLLQTHAIPSLMHHDDTTTTSNETPFFVDNLGMDNNLAISPVSIIVDTGNVAGDHHNNIVIGGIQNFSERSTADILKMLQFDVNNSGGIHHNTVTIGGMLIY